MSKKLTSILLILSLLLSFTQEIDYAAESLKVHAFYKGKLSVVSKVTVNDRDDLSVAYTPGVAEPCKKIAEEKPEEIINNKIKAITKDSNKYIRKNKNRRTIAYEYSPIKKEKRRSTNNYIRKEALDILVKIAEKKLDVRMGLKLYKEDIISKVTSNIFRRSQNRF